MKLYLYTLVLLSLFLLSACYKSAIRELPSDVLSMEKMADLLIDIHLAEGYLSPSQSNEERDSLAGVYYASILKIHNLDTASLNYNMNNYMRNPAKLAEVYTLVLSKMDTSTNALPKNENNK